MSLPPMAILFLRRWYRYEIAQRDRTMPIRLSFESHRLARPSLAKHPVFREMVDAGFLIPSAEPDCYGTYRLNLESESLAAISDRVVYAMIESEGAFGSTINEFATHILLNGNCPDTYGSWYLFDDSLAHVCLCGVNWETSAGPSDVTWSVFTDTYSPNDESPMVSVRLDCKCGKVSDNDYKNRRLRAAEVGIEPPGTAELIRLISDGFLKD